MSDEALRVDVRVSVGGFELDLKLQLAAGECRALIGPNGSGKSIALRTLVGAHAPKQGKIWVGARCVYDSEAKVSLPPESRRVGFLPQDYGLFPHLSALGNVEFAVRCRHPEWARTKRAVHAAKLLEELGVGEIRGRRPGELSGGERQRVGLARALAAEPVLLLLDEPMAALDIEVRREVRSFLQRTLKRLALPVVIVAHEPDDVFALADTVTLVERGVVVETGTVTEMARQPQTRFASEFWRTSPKRDESLVLE